MKVNIQGRGLVYSLGINAPVKNIDLSEAQIRRILPVRSLQVFDAETNLLITTRNVNEFFKLKGDAVVEAIKKETKRPAKKEVPVVVEQVAEPAPVVEEVVEAPAVEEPKEEIPVEVNEEAELTSDEEEAYEEAEEAPVSESGDEAEPAEETEYVPKKKNKKRR
jgi:hypothetical protein